VSKSEHLEDGDRLIFQSEVFWLKIREADTKNKNTKETKETYPRKIRKVSTLK
jgi:hypothetical protein